MIHAPTINARTWFCIKKKNSAKSIKIFIKPCKKCTIAKLTRCTYMDEIFNA